MAGYEMRDNTGEWFGSLPVNWSILPLKYAFSIKKEIAGKLGYTVLSVTQKGIKPKDMLDKGQFALDYSKYQLVNRGEFIMNHMDLLTGWVDIATESGVTSPDYRVFYNADLLWYGTRCCRIRTLASSFKYVSSSSSACTKHQ